MARSSSLFALALAAIVSQYPAHAWFRLLCSGNTLVRERLDPIIEPGVNPSQHVHTVQGGSNFAPDSTTETLRDSSCTSCAIAEDKSNYWYPQLYFHSPKDNLFYLVGNGGLDAYYLQRGDGEATNGGSGLKAFPDGFKMVSGDPTLRRDKSNDTGISAQQKLGYQAPTWICLRYSAGQPDVYSDSVPGQGFPTSDCESGFQTRLQFPSCWDGKNVDSDNHRDHVAYLSGLDNGACPDTHPVPLVHLFYETTWDVHEFVTSGQWDPSTSDWPFVYATGDPSGWSLHADFQNGWDDGVQQRTIDNCNHQDNSGQANGDVDACTEVTVQAQDTYSSCTTDSVVNEEVGSQSKGLTKLPGCNPLQDGPDDATIYFDNDCPF